MEERAKDEYRKTRALEACDKYGHPSKQFKVFGVTGTNGKTTTTYLLESALKAAGERVGVIGTVENRFENWRESSKLTTPGSDDLQALLRHYLDLGATAVAMEVSSHALDQLRTAGTHFAGTIFTNLTQDHLDYHVDMEHYFLSKRRLFVDSECAMRSVHINSAWGQRLINELNAADLPAVSFGATGGHFNYGELTFTAQGITGNLSGYELISRLMGPFNAENITGVAALLIRLGYDPSLVMNGLSACTGIPGRLEQVSHFFKHNFSVLVDYAHTPDALEKALLALKPLTIGRLVVVFGCGGDRDTGKRPLMGAIAERIADDVIITSDNPRTEDPLMILQAIAKGLKNPGKAQLEPDRAAAIHMAVSKLSKGDILLIAGKGHEDYQIVGTEKRLFDDRVIAKEALKAFR